jgi:hypothetical protein
VQNDALFAKLTTTCIILQCAHTFVLFRTLGNFTEIVDISGRLNDELA